MFTDDGSIIFVKVKSRTSAAAVEVLALLTWHDPELLIPQCQEETSKALASVVELPSMVGKSTVIVAAMFSAPSI
jgi:hypothetical protein